MALLDTDSRDEIQKETLKIEKIETAVEKNFQEYFVNAMAIPHKVDDFIGIREWLITKKILMLLFYLNSVIKNSRNR
jgi:uncharacterized 2Fe-2S/4Fe-4S cluster protein (DUF4445 family)